MKTILILDDDRKLGKLLTDYLSQFNLKAVAVFHSDDAIRFLKREVPDLIVLDVMLPGRDGFEMCKEIRRDYTVPMIICRNHLNPENSWQGFKLFCDVEMGRLRPINLSMEVWNWIFIGMKPC